MFKVQAVTTYKVYNDKNYQNAVEDLHDEIATQKLAAALNDQEQKHKEELASATENIIPSL